MRGVMCVLFVAACAEPRPRADGHGQAATAEPEATAHEGTTADAVAAPATASTGNAAAAAHATGPATDDAAAPAPRAELDAVHVPAIAAAARDYPGFIRLRDGAAWAPELCALAMAHTNPPRVGGEGSGAHRGKLFFVRAKSLPTFDPRTAKAPPDEQPLGQVVVKESFVPEPVDAVSSKARTDVVAHEGRTYRPGARDTLFVMVKLDPATPRTDRGWIYGTVTADGVVTSAGLVAACAGCHASASRDCLFHGP